MKLLYLSVLMGITSYAAAAKCKNETYYATTVLNELRITNFDNNENCTIDIKPNSTLAGKHYLEMTWWRFEVDGVMPDCKEDYVEVFLTSSQQSTGRFCTNNTEGSPFDMYSYDGHAKIRFISDGQGKSGGFLVHFKLKPYSGSMGTSQSQVCSKTYSMTHTDVVHSAGWPVGYAASNTKCRHEIVPGNNIVWKETVITIMDLDVNNRSPAACDEQDDYIQIKGSDGKKPVKEMVISDRLCKLDGTMSFRTRYKNIYVDFVRQRGSGGSHRGYMIGYKGYFFKSGTIGPDELRNQTKGGDGKSVASANYLFNFHLLCIVLVLSKIFLA